MKKIMESGTHADKISALSIRVRDHPKFCIEALVKLLAMVKIRTIVLIIFRQKTRTEEEDYWLLDL